MSILDAILVARPNLCGDDQCPVPCADVCGCDRTTRAIIRAFIGDGTGTVDDKTIDALSLACKSFLGWGASPKQIGGAMRAGLGALDAALSVAADTSVCSEDSADAST